MTLFLPTVKKAAPPSSSPRARLRGHTIGFIGLGLMGKPMSRNLQTAGAALVIHNRSQPVVEELAGEGMTAAATPRDVAERVGAGVIVLMLTNAAAVEDVVSGAQGLFAGLKKGALVIDMGSSKIEPTRELARLAKKRGAAWLDAPVSGGQVGAINGTLSIMAGGTPASFRRAQPYFSVLGGRSIHVGKSGAGQTAKLANQIIVAVTIAAVAEAFTLGKSVGVDPRLLREALLGGFAASRILDLHGRRMIENNFQPGGRANLQLKDIVEAVRLMRASGLNLPMLKSNLKLWQEMVARGWGDLDHAGLIKLYAVRPRRAVRKKRREGGR